jgi:hypothetical protein
MLQSFTGLGRSRRNASILSNQARSTAATAAGKVQIAPGGGAAVGGAAGGGAAGGGALPAMAGAGAKHDAPPDEPARAGSMGAAAAAGVASAVRGIASEGAD